MNETRYFILFNRENMAGQSTRFWTYRSGHDYVVCFMKDGTKGRAWTYTESIIKQILEDKKWQEITEAEAALL